jgi:hypothetical protein
MSRSENGYRYALMLYREDGSPLGRAKVEVDWEPAEEWARFSAVRQGSLGITEQPEVAIQPLWSSKLGEPYMRGFRVDVRGRPVPESASHADSGSESSSRGCSGDASSDFAIGYFIDLARQASVQLVESGHLKTGESYLYLPVAFPGGGDDEGGLPEGERGGFTADEVIPPLPLRSATLETFLSGSAPVGEMNTLDLPAFVPRRILSEATRLVQEADQKEVGGILIGHLHRDSGRPEIFVEVTGQIPARNTEADLTTLRFTAETWTQVQSTLDLRGREEIMLGWWHSHPKQAWCKECQDDKDDKRADCQLLCDFFSAHDRRLHRAVFPRAYSIALVVNDMADGHTYSMFGWRKGQIELRGFHLARDPSETRRGPQTRTHTRSATEDV